jgi:homoserine kinase
LYCAIVFPDVDVPTREARQIIRNSILLKDAVTQWGNIAGLVSGLYMTGDIDLIGRSMKDVLVEPVRAMLIPDFYLRCAKWPWNCRRCKLWHIGLWPICFRVYPR